jgi:hypothetical protein
MKVIAEVTSQELCEFNMYANETGNNFAAWLEDRGDLSIQLFEEMDKTYFRLTFTGDCDE